MNTSIRRSQQLPEDALHAALQMASASNVLARKSKKDVLRYRIQKVTTPVDRDRHAQSRHVPVETMLEQPMDILQERRWPAIDIAELRFGIAFGSTVEVG
jgi:hypothetical protein